MTSKNFYNNKTRKEKTMQLTELQNVLSDMIQEVRDEFKVGDDRKRTVQSADLLIGLSKQMINNANTILRAEKLVAQGYDVPGTENLI